MEKTIVLEAKNLSKIYCSPTPIEILQDISLIVLKGETLAIMGPSGIGKSTLLHILGTLDTPTTGSLYIMGKNPWTGDLPFLRNQHIGFIFQNYNLLDEYSALENVLMPAKIGRKKTTKESFAFKRALMLLELMHLTKQSSHLAKQLSGGEKQRVAIARALMNDPDIILADEPSGNLDDVHSDMIHKLLISSAKEFSKTLIVVTHNSKLAALCDHIYHLEQGKLKTKKPEGK